MNKTFKTYDMNLESSPELQKFVADFWAHNLTVEPTSLFDALKAVKNRLYGSIRKEAR